LRKLFVVIVIVVVGIGTGAGIVLGSDSQDSASIKAAALDKAAMPMHRVGAPSTGTQGKVAAKAHHRAKVIYLETHVFTLRDGDTQLSTGTCPRRSKAINGYFGNDTPGVVPAFDSVGNSLRKWVVGLTNLTDTNARVFLGTVCLKP
jgi:hypothetical protein